MAPSKLLLTGATGYIGGTVLTRFVSSVFPSIKNLSYTVLVRQPEQAEYYKSQGITPILFENLDQLDLLKKAASEHDIVVNTASAFRPLAARALIEGLAERKKATGGPVYFIHTSGTSSIGNRPVSKAYTAEADHEFSDKDQDIYAYELMREEKGPYGQRTGDVAVVQAGEEHKIPTYILMSPTIYGTGSGAYNKRSIQIPALVKFALSKGYAEYIGDGAGVWDHAHVDDTAALYEIILNRLLAGEALPSGRKGIYFVGTGRASWKQVSDGIAKAGHELGVLREATARSADLEELAGGRNAMTFELGFASRSVTKADLARGLGWKPERTEEDWERGFAEEVRAAVEAAKSA
ncbi:Oxidase ucsJ-like protein [Cladobotryum mycophilum]|uniref:Oxidase ucsJ-like protein n=1 Tax=Cladobotryum mycophilum TaxID=491253 RepID=A0ABR0SB17_9HYPO